MLKEVRDANGNSLKYHCEVVENRAPGTEPWRQIYAKRITYTGSVGVDGPYEVVFNRESGRTDVMVDGRPGFKTVMDQRLASIDVSLTTAASPLIRRYVFSYQTSVFQKTLLAKVTQYAQDGVTEFNQHRFEYFDEVSTPTANLLNAFGPPQSFTGASTVQGDGLLSGFSSTAFGGSATTNQQVHFYGGIGEAVKEISAGFKVGADSGRTTTKLSLLDIDGDGLLDQVYQSGGQFAYRSNTGGPRSSGINFAPQVAFALPDLGRENSNTTTFGVQGFAIGINGLADFSLTRTRGEAYISDVNGDGLPDVVTGGTVFFNRLVGGKPAFDTTSPTPLGSSAASNTSGLVTDPNEARADIEAANSLADPLRRWVAPYTGTVSIVGDVRLVTTPAAGYATADGVRVAVQQNASEIFNLVLDNPADTTPKPILGLTVVPVTAGDRIYFRVNSRNDGSFDQVEFNPTITYTAFDANARDENALPVYVYNAAADFAYGGTTLTITTPVNGLATLAGSFVKSGVTSDDVSVRISQNGVVLATYTIAADQTATVPISQALTTATGDKLTVRIHADSRVDLTKVRFAPSLTYTQVEGSPAPVDDNGNPTLVMFPPVTAQIYPQQSMTPYAPVIAAQTGTLHVNISAALGPTVPSGYNADLTLTVKRRNQRLAKQLVQIRNGAIFGPASVDADIAVTVGDALFFTAAATTHDIANFATVSASYSFGGADPTPTPVDLHLAALPSEAFGGGYRRWYYGQYNGNNALAAVDESVLRQPTTQDDQVFRSFIGMVPFQNEDRFRVQDPDAWIAASRMSATRLGVKFLDFSDGGSFGGARGIVRFGGARNRAGSISVLAFGAGRSSGDNWSDIDFLDLNGDRYPDIVGGGSVQPTLSNGGLEDARLGVGAFGRVRESQSETFNVTLGATTQALRSSSTGKLLGIFPEMKGYNLSAGVSGGHGEFTSKWDLVDINGDGLPDYVRPSNGGLIVRLNLGYQNGGYHFGVEENWGGSGTLRFEKSANKGVNAGFTTPAYSFGGGISHTISKTGTQQDLIDINGDGLPDIVFKDVNDDADSSATSFTVRLNTGSGFTDPMIFDGAMPKPIRQNATVSRNLGFHFTYSICWPIPPICIILNPGFSTGDSLGGFEVQVADFNGDGYPDHIYSDTNGNVEVRLNNHGRTNLLKKVYRPLGATIDLEYERSGNTQDQPQSRWVMSKTTVFDGHVGEGADTQVTTFQYANGRYDRAERDFYGYATVTEEHRDTLSLNNLGSLEARADFGCHRAALHRDRKHLHHRAGRRRRSRAGACRLQRDALPAAHPHGQALLRGQRQPGQDHVHHERIRHARQHHPLHRCGRYRSGGRRSGDYHLHQLPELRHQAQPHRSEGQRHADAAARFQYRLHHGQCDSGAPVSGRSYDRGDRSRVLRQRQPADGDRPGEQGGAALYAELYVRSDCGDARRLDHRQLRPHLARHVQPLLREGGDDPRHQRQPDHQLLRHGGPHRPYRRALRAEPSHSDARLRVPPGGGRALRDHAPRGQGRRPHCQAGHDRHDPVHRRPEAGHPDQEGRGGPRDRRHHAAEQDDGLRAGHLRCLRAHGGAALSDDRTEGDEHQLQPGGRHRRRDPDGVRRPGSQHEDHHSGRDFHHHRLSLRRGPFHSRYAVRDHRHRRQRQRGSAGRGKTHLQGRA